MIGILHKLLATAAAAVALASAGQASAALNAYHPPNYTFPDGSQGFMLQTQVGALVPAVLVEFNPHGPSGIEIGPGVVGQAATGGGVPTQTQITLDNPFAPQLNSPVDGGAFDFLIALLDLGDGSVIPGNPVAPPNSDGLTGFHGMDGGHTIDINFLFGGSPVSSWSWGAFNPQPDPPGDFASGEIGFAADPFMGFDLRIDGVQQSFTLAGAPEPATWGLMIVGLLGAGLMLRRARTLALEPMA